MTLDRYIMRLLLVRTVFAVVVLILLVQVLELLDVSTDILQRGLGIAGIGRYSLLRLPGQFQQVVSLGVLVGSLFTFSQLSRTSEMVVIRATGANIYRVLRMMIPVVLLVAVVDFAVSAEIAPRTQDQLAHWMAKTEPASKAKPPKAHWFRLGPDLVLVGQASDDGHRLQSVRVYRRDASRTLTEEVSAPLATPEARGWRLHGATVNRVGTDRATLSGPKDVDWVTPLKPGDVVRLFRAGEQVTTTTAIGALAHSGPTDRSPGFYQTRLHRAFAEPLGVMVMLLLSAPAALASMRSDQGMRLMAFGLASGILFMVADALLTALGETSALPPLLASWSAPVAFTALAITVLLYAEG